MFTSNVARLVGYGGAIRALRTTVMLSGNQYFTNNSAMYGGGLAVSNYDLKGLIQSSTNTSTYFQRNYAHRHGAAIFVEDPPSIYCNSGSVTSEVNRTESCLFQIESTVCIPYEHILFYDSYLKRRVQEHNAHMIFENNFAEESGHTLYGGTLDRCGICVGIYFVSGAGVFSELSGLPLEQYAGNVSSDPFQVCICLQLKPNCMKSTITRDIHPGETVSISVAAIGQVEGIVPGVIHARFNDSYEAELNHLQTTQTTSIQCTALQYTVYSKAAGTATLVLYVEGPCVPSVIPLSLTINFLPCPSGFLLSDFGACVCDPRLQKYTNSCDINRQAITRNGDFWVGFDDSSHGLILHPHCPFDYCKLETVSFTSNSTDLQCGVCVCVC